MGQRDTQRVPISNPSCQPAIDPKQTAITGLNERQCKGMQDLEGKLFLKSLMC